MKEQEEDNTNRTTGLFNQLNKLGQKSLWSHNTIWWTVDVEILQYHNHENNSL